MSAVPELIEPIENINVVLLSPNTTDSLQPMDELVNTLDYLKR